MKAFFGKIWAWVLANKVLSAIIAGATVAVLTVAIVVPVSVSAAKKKKAAQEQQTQESQPGGEQGGGSSGSGDSHTHTYADSWSSDATNHWHAATCGHNVKSGEAAHSLDTHGFCTVCDYYGGTTIDDISQHWNVGTTETGKTYYSRIKLQSGKEYVPSCSPTDPKVSNTGTFVWQKTDDGFVDVNLMGTVTLNPASVDGYLYFHLEFTQSLDNVSFWIEEHAHTFANVWSSNTTHHWHAATCWHDVKSDYAEHTLDQNGFCTVCGAFGGPTFTFTNQGGWLDFSHEQMDMTANQVYFCRIGGAISGHIFELEDGDPLSGDPGTNLDDALVGYTMIDGLPSLVDLSGTIPSEIGSDGYLYIKIDASNLYDRDDVWFRIVQNHAPNDFGFCSVDGCDYYCGLLRTVGVSTNYNFQSGKKVFLRYEAVKGHQYYISHSGGLTAPEINAYSISSTDSSFVIIPNIKIGPDGGVFPADAADSYIYVVITPSDTYYGGLTVNYSGHGSLDSYGFCNACGEYDGTPVVGMNIPDIDLEFGEEAYYRFPINQHFAYELEDSTPEMTDGVTKGYLNLSSGLEEYEFDSANYIEDIGDGYMYLVINCTYVGGINNGELVVHEFEEPINLYGFYNLCQEYTGFDLEYEVVFEPISLENGERLFLRFNLEDLPADKPVIEITYTSGASSSTCINYDNVIVYYFQSEAATLLLPDDWYGGNWNVEYYPTSSIVTDDGYLYIVITADRAYTDSMGFCISSVAE